MTGGRALLVTGTDTGVGKTFVTAALAARLAARGVRVAVAKPAETGCRKVGDTRVAEDAATLAAAAGDGTPAAVVCRWALPEPLAPALAASRAGVAIDVAAVATDLRTRAAAADVLLIEGAGGLLVPLAGRTTFADLAALVGAAVVVVVGSRLGAINHALLTLEVCARRRLPVAGYVVNDLLPPGDLAVDTNAALLASLTAVPCLGRLPHRTDAAALLAALRAGDGAARAALAALAADHLALAAS